MNVTSQIFFVFFFAIAALYYFPPFRRVQLWILLLGSIFFYAYEVPILVLLLFFSCFVSALTSYYALRSQGAGRRLLAASLGIGVNLLVLGFFKYKFLYLSTAEQAPEILGTAATQGLMQTLLLLPLPIGISFYTFHGISLIVDAFRRRDRFFVDYQPPLPNHLLRTTLYLVFFPQLIAGPIVKAKDFFPQIKPKFFSEVDWGAAVRYLITGYFLKSVIADNLQDQTFFIRAPYFLAGASGNLIMLLFGYSMQIFADFAGYSLIAMGLGVLLGYRLPQNFNFPYISQSISDFWRRWHISLSSWLRDYVYIPLGGNRHGSVRTYVNLITVMFLGGLWHGAAWSYAIWGLWHGVGLAIERPLLNTRFYTSRNAWMAAVRILVVFVFASLGWLLFKLPNFSEAVSYFHAMIANRSYPTQTFPILVILIFSLPVIAYHGLYLSRSRKPLNANLQHALLAAMLFLIITDSGHQVAFIYFQF